MDHSPRLTPKGPTAQADIRDYFHSSPIISPTALTTPSHPIAHARAKSDAAHNAIFEEWIAPVYVPRTPQSKSDDNSIRKRPQNARNDLILENPGYLAQIPIIPATSRSGSRCGHIPAQPEDFTKISKGSRRSLASDGETLFQVPLTLLGDTPMMDHSLVPEPLKLTSHHSPTPSADGSTVTASTEASGSFMKSRVMSAHEKHGLDIDPLSTELVSLDSDVSQVARHITTKPILPRLEFQSSRLTWDDEAAMYLVPSPTLKSSVPSIPEKARRILGTDGDKNNIPKIQPVAQPECEIYTGPAWANGCQTSRHRLETAREVRVAEKKSIEASRASDKKKKKGGRLAKFIFRGAVDDRVA